MLTSPVIEQANPHVILVSSKADDGCIDVLRNHSQCTTYSQRIYPPNFLIVDASAGVFQIRPHKDFIASKGRDRILSLQLLSVLPMDDSNPSHVAGASSDSESRNAYDFMQRRRDATGDPHTQRWNASIRLANYASIDGSPLCVSMLPWPRPAYAKSSPAWVCRSTSGSSFPRTSGRRLTRRGYWGTRSPKHRVPYA